MTDPAGAPPARLNPYVGPRAFQYGEAIYGRSHEIAELRDVLIARRIVLLYSPSGAGKSSLIEAGLRVELAEGGFRLFPTIRVGAERPPELDGLAVRNRYVLSTILSLEEGQPPERQLPHAELATIDLAGYLDRFFEDDGSGSEPCLIFDQFEELFTLDPTDVDAKRAFLTEIGLALRDRGRWVLFAMREDFIAQLDPYLGLLPTRLASRYRLDLLDPSAAKLAAQRPAAELGVAFADDAADRLVNDLRRVRVQRGAVAADELGPNVEPVQLQVVCRQLWSTLDPAASSIEVDDVVALGNVDDALADFYVDEIVAVAARTGVSEREIRTWFDEQLISPDGFRTQVLDGPGAAAGPAVLRELENAHLIRADRRRGTEWYELSHDRLVAPVRASNARWREEHLNPLQREAQIWDARSRPQGLLITGEVLTEAEEWVRTHEGELLPVDREYLEASRAEQRRVDLERKVARRNRVLAIVAAGVAVAAIIGLVAAIQLRATAAEQRDRARAAQAAQQSAEDAQAHLNASNAWLAAGAQADQPQRQLLSWLAAFKAHPDNPSADLVRKLTTAQHYLHHDPVYVASASALSPTGTTFARGRADGRVEIVDVATLQRQRMIDIGQPVDAVAFSPTEDVVAVAAGASVSLWQGETKSAALSVPQLSDGARVTELSLADGPNGVVAGVVRDAATDVYGRLVVWDQGAPATAPVGADVRVARAVVAGDRLAVIAETSPPSDVGAMRVWQRTAAGWQEQEGFDPDLVPPGPPAMKPYAALTFSPDASYVAAGTVDGLKVYPMSGAGASPVSQPADVAGPGALTVVGAAFPSATADAVRAIDMSGQVVDWQLVASGEWQAQRGPQLAPSVDVQMDAAGDRALLSDGTAFTIADTTTGSRFVGQLAVSQGSTSHGRSVVVQRSGALDEQASPNAPWSRGALTGTVAVALSPDAQRRAGLVAPSGDVQIASAGGTAAEQPMCPDVTVAAQSASASNGSNGGAVAVAVGDNGVVAATAAVPAVAADPAAPARSSWCLLPTDAGAVPQPSLAGERFDAVRVSADGQLFVVGAELNGGGTVDVYPVETGELAATQPMTGAVTAVALSPDVAPLVAAGDAQGNLLAFQMGSADAASGFGSEIRCDVPLPVSESVVAVSVGKDPDGQYLLAAATRKSVFVYRISIASSPCATLIGGFDLLREEGDVIDLAFDESGMLSVLESDFNVFTFNPVTTAAAVADDVTQRAADRGWALSESDCTALFGTSRCPT